MSTPIIPPTADEVCRVIELAAMFYMEEHDSKFTQDFVTMLYQFAHIRSENDITCRDNHDGWVETFRKHQEWLENHNKAPSDISKRHDLPVPPLYAAQRMVNGFEVAQDWKMPEPPEPGLVPYCQFHGGDGHSLFWDKPCENGYWPSPVGPRDNSWHIDENDDPIIDPDTGGVRYKECEEAYAELGFTVL